MTIERATVAADSTFMTRRLLVLFLLRVMSGPRGGDDVLRLIINVLARTDPGIWYLLDLRHPSMLSWVPGTLLLGMLVFATVECLIAGNISAAAILAALALTMFAVKLRVSTSA
jgi:hypothetical protein